MNLKDVKPASERKSGNRQQKNAQQRPATVDQPGRDRSPQPMDVKSSNRVGKDERPMKVTLPKKDDKPQPSKSGTNKDKKKKKKPGL